MRRPEPGGEKVQTAPPEPGASLALWDWRRAVSELYAAVRRLPPREGWEMWLAERQRLLRTHPQSPVKAAERLTYQLRSYPYEPGLRMVTTVAPTEDRSTSLPASGPTGTGARAFGRAGFRIAGIDCSLTLFWLDGYAGGVFVPFRDRTNGAGTYGGGRYLLDTAKGADLGGGDGEVVLDFNFAYHPSCAYDPEWSCPLAPVENHLPVAVIAGERLE